MSEKNYLESFNNTIDTTCVTPDTSVLSSTVIPAGRHRNNYILAVTRIINVIRGVSVKITSDTAEWSIRTADMVELTSALNIIPNEYVNDNIKNAIDLIKNVLSQAKTKNSGVGRLTSQNLTTIIEAVFSMVSDIKTDIPKVMAAGILYGGGIGNMIGIQPKYKPPLCDTCPNPEFIELINDISNSKAKTLFDIENSMSQRSEMTGASYSTSDAMMTNRSKYMPLEFLYRNATKIEDLLTDYDPSKLITSPMQWGITNSDDTLNDLIILFKTGIAPRPFEPAKPNVDIPDGRILFSEHYNEDMVLKEVKGTNGTIFKLAPRDKKTHKSDTKKRHNRKDLQKHFEYIISMSRLEDANRDYFMKYSSKYSQYGMNNKYLNHKSLIEEINDLLNNQEKRISDKDMRLCFGDEITNILKNEYNKVFVGDEMNLMQDEDYIEEFSAFVDNMKSEAVISDRTEESLKDYVFFTTLHTRTRFNISFIRFAKIITIYDEYSEQLVKQKVQPGAKYSFYCKYLGIHKDSLLPAPKVEIPISNMTAVVRYKDLKFCDKRPFIEIFNEKDVDIDGDKLKEWNEKTVYLGSPILKIEDLSELANDKELIDCIMVNMWYNEILEPLQPYVAQIDDIIRNDQVLLSLKMKTTTLYNIVKTAGATAFVSGAHVPRKNNNDTYYYILMQVVLINNILRHGILGVDEAGTPSDVLKTMNAYIKSVQTQ